VQAVKAERGYLIVAQGEQYHQCARALAKSIKYWMPGAQIAVVGDCKDTVFNYEIELPHGDQGGLQNDWQVLEASPFRQTIKLESDMILNGSIEHWWQMFEKQDVVVAQGACNFYGERTAERAYRKHLDLNNLPDVYNAITYWRRSELAARFFTTVREIFDNWDQVHLKGWTQPEPDTDTVYAIAITLLGKEQFLLPTSPKFTHMKGKINFCHGEDWTKELVWELGAKGLRINTIQQQMPTHYYIKSFAKQLEEHYEQLLASR
jgi:hypothetical protein